MTENAIQSYLTHGPDETIELGRSLANQLRPPVLVLLLGDLGAGKTTLTKGLAEGLGAASEQEVTSPTFTLIHEYGGAGDGGACVYHVDLYRIEDARDLGTIGLEDLLAGNNVVIVEWGEKLGPALRHAHSGGRVVEIRIRATGDSERRIEVREWTGGEGAGGGGGVGEREDTQLNRQGRSLEQENMADDG